MSKQIWTDENGNPIDYLAVRNEEIKDKLDEVLKLLLVEKAADKKGVKRFGYRMTVQLDSCLRSYGLMRADEFCDLTYDEIEDNFNRFQDLIAYYNRFFEVVANKQLFCAFFRINNRMYGQLERHKDEEIAALMGAINDSFIGLGFSASETGGASASATKTRLGAKDVGHSVVSASEELAVQAVTGKSPEELQRELSRLIGNGGEIKLIK